MSAHLPRLSAVAVVVALVGLMGGQVASADPTDETTAVELLLQAEDLFPDATTNGLSVGQADDLPAFAANGGLREVRQTWTSSEPIALVFDFRYQFPDEASAVAFLNASEADLAETSNGLVLTPLVDPPLPDTRFYAADLGSFGVNFNYLMHTGNLVAKVFVGGSGDISQDTASDIAAAAAARMTAALGGPSPSIDASSPPGSGVSPTGVPGSGAPESGALGSIAPPTIAPATTAPATTAPATIAPPSAPAEPPSPLPSPDPTVVSTLIATVPDSIAPTCAALLFTPDKPPRDGELARVGCIATNGAGISLSAFDSAESVNAAFLAGELVAQMFGQLSVSGTCEGGGYDGTWTLDGVAAGNLLCYTLERAAVIDWSDPANLLLGSVNQAVDDSTAAFEAWVEAGNGVRAPAN